MNDVNRDPITFGQLLAKPGVIEEVTLRGPVGLCAFHGGNLERRTEFVARSAAAQAGASYYGVIQPSGMRHHLPSTRIDPSDSEQFTAFLNHCTSVIAIHGYGRHSMFTAVLCGGANRSLARHVARHLADALPAYRIVDDPAEIPKGLRGGHPKNPCNYHPGGGVQVELPPRVRGVSPLAQWTPSAPDETFAHTADLIRGLAEAAANWPPTEITAERAVAQA